MRKEKQLLLDEIQDQINAHGSFLVMRYEKLSANRTNEFRREILKIGGSVQMIRKTLLIKATESMGTDLDAQSLPGHIGLVLAGKDPLETTKAVFRFSKENDQAIEVLAAKVDGENYTAEQIKVLAELPGKQELRAQFVGLLEAVPAQLVATINAIVSAPVQCLDGKIKKMEEK